MGVFEVAGFIIQCVLGVIVAGFAIAVAILLVIICINLAIGGFKFMDWCMNCLGSAVAALFRFLDTFMKG